MLKTCLCYQLKKIKSFVKVLKDNQDLIEECCVYTVFVVGSYLVKQFFNFSKLLFIKKQKTVFFKTKFNEKMKKLKMLSLMKNSFN